MSQPVSSRLGRAAAAALLGAAILSVAGPAAADTEVRASTVQVTVLSVDPATPAITGTPRPLTITVSLENTTDTTIRSVTLAAERGDPIGTQAALDSSLRTSAARVDGLPIRPAVKSTLTLAPHVPVTATFRTTTSTLFTDRLCLCKEAGVYPIDLSVRATVDGAADVLGGTRTYLPAFDVAPAAKLGVTWIWPLIDRPHRTVDGTVFTDDDLAESVDGGRLDRALQVVEQVAAGVPMTLMVDPDLLDELQVMAAGPYTIRAASAATPVPGTGREAAASWLARLRAVLDAHPNLDLELTPLGDPDVTGLTQRDRRWSAALNTQVDARVRTALGDRPLGRALAWPPTNTATTETLDQLVAGGAGTVLLDGSRVKPSSSNGIPVSQARLRTSGGTVSALLTAPVLQRLVQPALTGSSLVLPQLYAELAARVAQRPAAKQTVVLSAPRYVDPSPAAAAAVIRTTSTSVFTSPVRAAVAAESGTPTAVSSLRGSVRTTNGLDAQHLDRTVSITRDVPAVTSLIGGTPAGGQVLNTLPDAVQRVESAAWSPAGAALSVGGGPDAGASRAAALQKQLTGYLRSVTILRPNPNSYTLSSTTSPLPITVRNESPLTVRVRLSVRTVGGLPGFSPYSATKSIGPNTKTVVKVPTHIQRSGRIAVEAELHTPSNRSLGGPVTVFVHSTVLGTIGVVITIVAGVVLALALLVRYVRRVLRIRSKRAGSAVSP